MTDEHPTLWDCSDCDTGVMVRYANHAITDLFECTQCPHLQRLPFASLAAWNATPSRSMMISQFSCEEGGWLWEQWRNENE